MARTMTERIWLESENGPALLQFVERKAKPRKKLLATLAVVAKFVAFLGRSEPLRTREIETTQSLILREAEGEIPSAFMVANQHVRVDHFIAAAVMGQADLLTRQLIESICVLGPYEPIDRPLRDPELEDLRLGIMKFLADIVRDVIGNPFRSRLFQRNWRNSDTVGLAQAIYDDRAFDRLPILADALMDAGCEDEQIIAHCRGDGPHVRGCWVVDLILGKS